MMEENFIRFLSIFVIYWSLALQLLCITVRLSDGMFLFLLASKQQKINFSSVLWRPVSLTFSLLRLLGTMVLRTFLKGKLGWEWGDYFSLFCHFRPNLDPHFGPPMTQIWNSLNRILIFNLSVRQKLYYYQVYGLKTDKIK